MERKDRDETLLSFIREYVTEHGFPPTYREMAQAVGVSSTRSVSRRLTALREEGLLTWDEGKKRTLRLTTS